MESAEISLGGDPEISTGGAKSRWGSLTLDGEMHPPYKLSTA